MLFWVFLTFIPSGFFLWSETNSSACTIPKVRLRKKIAVSLLMHIAATFLKQNMVKINTYEDTYTRTGHRLRPGLWFLNLQCKCTRWPLGVTFCLSNDNCHNCVVTVTREARRSLPPSQAAVREGCMFSALCLASTYHLVTSKHLKWERLERVVQVQEQPLLKRTRCSTETSLNQTRTNDKCFLPAARWRHSFPLAG